MGIKPHHKPTDATRKLVRDMSVDHKSQEEIAKRMHISVDTLIKYYEYEVRHYKHDITYQIQDILIDAALKGKRWAVEKYLTCRADWAPYRRPEEIMDNNKKYVLVEYQDKIKEIENESNTKNDSRSTDICI